MKRMWVVWLLLAACGVAQGQSVDDAALVAEIEQVVSERSYDREDGTRMRCREQVAVARDAVVLVLQHPRLGHAAYGDWKARLSYGGRRLDVRAVVGELLAMHAELTRRAAAGESRCPPRNRIRTLASGLILVLREHARAFPDLEARPAGVAEFVEWKLRNQ